MITALSGHSTIWSGHSLVTALSGQPGTVWTRHCLVTGLSGHILSGHGTIWSRYYLVRPVLSSHGTIWSRYYLIRPALSGHGTVWNKTVPENGYSKKRNKLIFTDVHPTHSRVKFYVCSCFPVCKRKYKSGLARHSFSKSFA